MMKAVLFDFDGVLTLDESGSQSICSYISSATGIDKNLFASEYKKYNAGLQTGKHTHEEIWDKICSEIGHNIKIDVLYDSFINTRINFEMLELAREIKSKNYKIGIVTDNKADRMKIISEHHNNWDNVFDFIAVSAEIGSCKNQEHIFLRTFQALDVKPEECIFIDNDRENLVIPQKLGLKTIFYDWSKNDIVGLKNELFGLLNNIKLETERLIIRPYEESDLPDYHKLLSDKKNMYYLDDITTNSLEESAESLKDAVEKIKNGEARRFAVTLKENDTLIGGVGYDITAETPVGKIGHMGWFIMPEYQNRGYITEAAKKVLEFAFLQDNCVRITTGCYKDNIPTQKVMNKVGFKKEGERIKAQWHDGEMKDRLEFVINRDEFTQTDSAVL